MTSRKSLTRFVSASLLTLSFVLISVMNTMAGYIADSDMSNKAGSNIGRNQTGMYIFICLLLVLSVVVAYRKKNTNKG